MEDFIIAWTPVEDGDNPNLNPKQRASVGKVLVVPHPDDSGDTDGFALTVGSCFEAWHRLTRKDQERVLAEWALLLVSDGISKDDVFSEFDLIERWRKREFFRGLGLAY